MHGSSETDRVPPEPPCVDGRAFDVDSVPTLEEIPEKLRAIVREHPTASLAASALLGVVLARIALSWRER